MNRNKKADSKVIFESARERKADELFGYLKPTVDLIHFICEGISAKEKFD